MTQFINTHTCAHTHTYKEIAAAFLAAEVMFLHIHTGQQEAPNTHVDYSIAPVATTTAISFIVCFIGIKADVWVCVFGWSKTCFNVTVGGGGVAFRWLGWVGGVRGFFRVKEWGWSNGASPETEEGEHRGKSWWEVDITEGKDGAAGGAFLSTK